MYKKNRNKQLNLTDFNQPMGLNLDPENKWIKKAEMIPWNRIEDKYATLFESTTGTVAKPLRMALGSLMIQKEYSFSDRTLVEQLQENPYFQYFIGLAGFQLEAPFAPSLLVEFRKRLTEDILMDINELILKGEDDDDQPTSGGGADEGSDAQENNKGTLILDATCAPQNIEFPQDINLLNETREKLEGIIDAVCSRENLDKPRTYRKMARRDYLNLARSKKRTAKRIRKAIRQQLQYIRRDRGYLSQFEKKGIVLSEKESKLLQVLDKVHEQQKFMYDNKVHTIENRIVSISQPYIRPIVRGKSKAQVEFGAKLDLSIARGFGRIEKISFEAYNESEVLANVIERYKQRTGHYPERILADKIYRNRNNLAYCKERNIRLSGPALGRPRKDAVIDKKAEYRDNADRVEVERAFSLAKGSYGLGLIRTKLEETTRGSIVLSILVMNINRKLKMFLLLFFISIFSRFKIRKLFQIKIYADAVAV
jgi:transposase, IS5 family